MPRPWGHCCRQMRLEMAYTAVRERRDHERRGERHAGIELLCLREQRLLLDAIDLVEHEPACPCARLEPVEDALYVGVAALGGIDEQHDEIGIVRDTPRGVDHGAVEAAARREDAGRIDEDELASPFDGDSANRGTRRLHLAADDRDL